jgi:hypothetical protein
MNLPPVLPKFELPENELHSFFIKYSQEIIELLQESSKVLRDPPRIELLCETGPFIRIDDTLDIITVVMTRKSLKGEREVLGYQLVTYDYYPGNCFEPPDVDEVYLGEPNQNHKQIVIEAIKWHVAIILEQKIENICIEQSLREE